MMYIGGTYSRLIHRGIVGRATSHCECSDRHECAADKDFILGDGLEILLHSAKQKDQEKDYCQRISSIHE